MIVNDTPLRRTPLKPTDDGRIRHEKTFYVEGIAPNGTNFDLGVILAVDAEAANAQVHREKQDDIWFMTSTKTFRFRAVSEWRIHEFEVNIDAAVERMVA